MVDFDGLRARLERVRSSPAGEDLARLHAEIKTRLEGLALLGNSELFGAILIAHECVLGLAMLRLSDATPGPNAADALRWNAQRAYAILQFQGDELASKAAPVYAGVVSDVLESIKTQTAATMGVIYFVQHRGGSEIKIGYAGNAVNRLRQLRTGSPTGLTVLLLLPGTPSDEAALHARFQRDRKSSDNEWFAPSAELRAYIEAELKSGRALEIPPGWSGS